MKNIQNYFKKRTLEKPLRSLLQQRRRGFISNGAFMLTLGAFLLIPFLSFAGSLQNVSQSVKQVESVECPFQFAIMGDSQNGDKVYSQLLRAVIRRRPHFLIHVGDMIHVPHEREWQSFFAMTKQINFPFFPVAGNHDVGTTQRGREIYQKQLSLPGGRAYYALRAGETLFIILDSEEEKGKIIKEQRAWLEETLSPSQETFKFVFLHRPLFLPRNSLKRGRALDKYPLERDDLHRLFVRTRVTAVFSGDDHRYDRTEKDGILYFISGGGGAPLGAFKESGGYHHYIWISVQKERIEGEVVDLEGQVLDRFVINTMGVR